MNIPSECVSQYYLGRSIMCQQLAQVALNFDLWAKITEHLTFEDIATQVRSFTKVGKAEEKEKIYQSYLDTIDVEGMIEEQRENEEDWDYEDDPEYLKWVERHYRED